MHTDRPVTQWFKGAVPRKQPGPASVLDGFAGRWACYTATALGCRATRSKKPLTRQPLRPDTPNLWVLNLRNLPRRGGQEFRHQSSHQNGVGCMGTRMALPARNCHGAGSEHVAGGGDVTKIFDPAKASVKDVDTKCLSCHAGAHPNFDRSPHAKANVGCTQLPQHSRQQGRGAAQGFAADSLLPMPCRPEGAVWHAFHHPVNEAPSSAVTAMTFHGTFQRQQPEVDAPIRA